MIEYCLLSILLLINQAFAQDDSSAAASSEEDQCASSTIEEYNLGLRVGSIFIILATTAIGTYAPILLHRISPYKQGDIRDWILTVGKFCKVDYFFNYKQFSDTFE